MAGSLFLLQAQPSLTTVGKPVLSPIVKNQSPPEWKQMCVKVEPDIYERFWEAARSQHRTMAGEMRLLIEARLAAYELEKEAAA